MSIELIGVTKHFGDFRALDDLSLAIRGGELLALLGPSGSGKTSLLRLIAGLDWPDRGDIHFSGESVLPVEARRRKVGFVFQHYALFRHMNVFDNVAFGLTARGKAERLSSEKIAARVTELLHLVQIEWLAERFPDELSGGQRQRVALARALAIEPSVLLLDEPFGALDAKVRKELRRWLRRLNAEMRMTSIFVTHDQEEAMEVADRIVVMNHGRIEQIGKPGEVYADPVNAFVFDFLGSANRIPCRQRGMSAFHPHIDLSRIACSTPEGLAYIRAHDIEILPRPGGSGTLRFLSAAGPIARAEIAIPDHADPVEIELPWREAQRLGLAVGMTVDLAATAGKVF